jgi:hypothetical protein
MPPNTALEPTAVSHVVGTVATITTRWASMAADLDGCGSARSR